MQLVACQFTTLPPWHGVVKLILGDTGACGSTLAEYRHCRDWNWASGQYCSIGCSGRPDPYTVVYSEPTAWSTARSTPAIAVGAKCAGSGELIIATGPLSLVGFALREPVTKVPVRSHEEMLENHEALQSDREELFFNLGATTFGSDLARRMRALLERAGVPFPDTGLIMTWLAEDEGPQFLTEVRRYCGLSGQKQSSTPGE